MVSRWPQEREEIAVNKWNGLSTAIELYFLFSTILWNIFHTAIMFFIAAMATAIVGLALSLLVGDKA